MGGDGVGLCWAGHGMEKTLTEVLKHLGGLLVTSGVARFEELRPPEWNPQGHGLPGRGESGLRPGTLGSRRLCLLLNEGRGDLYAGRTRNGCSGS